MTREGNLCLIGCAAIFGVFGGFLWQLSARVDRLAQMLEARETSVSATANGNIVNVGNRPNLPNGPRTVQQVARYLDVTEDTVRDSYIPAWIAEGLMDDGDKLKNRWLIPETFEPYRPK